MTSIFARSGHLPIQSSQCSMQATTGDTVECDLCVNNYLACLNTELLRSSSEHREIKGFRTFTWRFKDFNPEIRSLRT